MRANGTQWQSNCRHGLLFHRAAMKFWKSRVDSMWAIIPHLSDALYSGGNFTLCSSDASPAKCIKACWPSRRLSTSEQSAAANNSRNTWLYVCKGKSSSTYDSSWLRKVPGCMHMCKQPGQPCGDGKLSYRTSASRTSVFSSIVPPKYPASARKNLYG